MARKLHGEQQKKERQNEPGNEKWRDNGQQELIQLTSMHVSIVDSKMSIKHCNLLHNNRRPVGSVSRVPDYREGGCGFKSRPDQHSGSLNN